MLKWSPQLGTASEEEPCHVSAERGRENSLAACTPAQQLVSAPLEASEKVVRDSAPGENSEDQALAIKTWEVPWDLRQDAAPEKEGMAEDGVPVPPAPHPSPHGTAERRKDVVPGRSPGDQAGLAPRAFRHSQPSFGRRETGQLLNLLFVHLSLPLLQAASLHFLPSPPSFLSPSFTFSPFLIALPVPSLP